MNDGTSDTRSRGVGVAFLRNRTQERLGGRLQNQPLLNLYILSDLYAPTEWLISTVTPVVR